MQSILHKKKYVGIFFFVFLGSLATQANDLENKTGGLTVFFMEGFDKSLHSVKDTSSLFYYSFQHQQTVKYKDYVNDVGYSFITACKGGELELMAPDYGDDATYLWDGPFNFSARSKHIQIKDINTSYQGIFTVRVQKAEEVVLGKIKVIVKDIPSVNVVQKYFMAREPVHVQLADFDEKTKYAWEDKDGRVLSRSHDLWLPEQKPGKKVYKLTADRFGCKVHTPVEIVIEDRKRGGAKFNLVDVLRDPG